MSLLVSFYGETEWCAVYIDRQYGFYLYKQRLFESDEIYTYGSFGLSHENI